MIVACATHIPLKAIPAHVAIFRHGHRLQNPPRPRTPAPPTTPIPTLTTTAATTSTSATTTATTTTSTTTTTTTTTAKPTPPTRVYLQAGDEIHVSKPGVLTFSYDGNRYRVRHGILTLTCARVRVGRKASSPATTVLAVSLKQGDVSVKSGSRARRALVRSTEMLTFAVAANTTFIVDRNPVVRRTQAWTVDQMIIAARASDPALRINTRESYTAVADRRGIRLNVWPFDLSPLQRATTPRDGLPPYWAGGWCTVGCLPDGTSVGWPLKPFHQQHAIRAGIDELRPANFHVAVDIEANNFEPVYAIQSGYASVAQSSYQDTKVTVGDYTYWHIAPTVSSGQYVVAYKTEVGAVENGFGHLAFSEGGDNDYMNPLRPGGPLRPYIDSEQPVIGVPQIFSDGRVIDHVFDPQSFIHKTRYLTPVLAPAALAWRLYDSRGHPITGLEWALNSAGYISPSLLPVVFAPGASNPGYECFYTQFICIPNWTYNLAGGLTGGLPFGSMARGQYRLTVYAWDFAGNTSALDYSFTFPLAAAAAAKTGEFGPLAANFDP